MQNTVQSTNNDEVLVKNPDGSFSVTQMAAPAPRVSVSTTQETKTQVMWRKAKAILGDAKKEVSLQRMMRFRLENKATDAQLQRALVRSMGEKGLGLSVLQAEQLIALLHTDPRVRVDPSKPVAVVPPTPAVPVVPPAPRTPPPPQKPVAPLPESVTRSTAVTPPEQEQTIFLRGPIDELAMTVEEWRRLGGTPAARTEKIVQKIGLLARDAYRDRLAGLQAWNNSGVMHAYRTIARRAYTDGRSVRDIIAEGAPIDEGEFLTIARLNGALRA